MSRSAIHIVLKRHRVCHRLNNYYLAMNFNDGVSLVVDLTLIAQAKVRSCMLKSPERLGFRARRDIVEDCVAHKDLLSLTSA